MDTQILQGIRESLARQRHNLLDWLQTTPTEKRIIRLGPAGEESVQAHLHVLDTALSKAESRTLGLCTVCHDYVEADRLKMDFTASVCIDHYSAEQKRELEWELELSHKVQRSLLPQQLPQIPGLQVAAFSQPAEIVTGDYFDFFRYREGAHGFVIADVMGKGLPASLLMASLQASLRILGPDNDSPATVVQKLNTLFCHNTQLIKFITLFLAHFDSATQTLTYCNAGHNPPVLLARSQGKEPGAVRWLKPTGAAIGLAESFSFGNESVELSPGDVLVLYTDGLTETRNSEEEEFSEHRLAEVVQRHFAVKSQELIAEIRLALHHFAGHRPLDDDMTMVVVKA